MRLAIHHAMQQLAQADVVAPLHRADKRKRNLLGQLLELRRLAADWGDAPGAAEPTSDYKEYVETLDAVFHTRQLQSCPVTGSNGAF